MPNASQLYDIVAHVIPGMIGIMFGYWTYAILFGRALLPSLQQGDLGSSLLFIVVCYVAGTVAQAVGEAVEWLVLPRIWKLPLMKRFKLRSNEDGDGSRDDARYNPMYYLLWNDLSTFQLTSAFRAKLQDSIREVFDLDLDNNDKSNLNTSVKAHGLCYSLILQKSASQRSERIKAIFRLFRGSFVVLTVMTVLLMLSPFVVAVTQSAPTVDSMPAAQSTAVCQSTPATQPEPMALYTPVLTSKDSNEVESIYSIYFIMSAMGLAALALAVALFTPIVQRAIVRGVALLLAGGLAIAFVVTVVQVMKLLPLAALATIGAVAALVSLLFFGFFSVLFPVTVYEDFYAWHRGNLHGQEG